MKVLKYVLIGIAAIVALVLVLGLFAPKDVKVERTILIKAPKRVVLTLARSLKSMHDWSPWTEKDPNMKTEFTGNDGEVGSTLKWEGNSDVGEGMQTITGISDSRVDIDLHFMKPMESTAKGYITLDDAADGIKTTWGFTSQTPYPLNAMHLFMDMDDMVGKDFDKGLQKLKKMSENAKDSSSSAYAVEEVSRNSQSYVTKRGVIPFSEISQFYMTNFPMLMGAVMKARQQPTGPPCGIFFKWDEKNMKADMAAAVPVDSNAKVQGYTILRVPAGKALHVAYYGAYDKSESAHMAINEYMKQNALSTDKYVIEEYVTDPGKEKDTARWLTNIYYMVKPGKN
jgi:effector-binding domain-containing protein